jgi:histidinol-phosphatase
LDAIRRRLDAAVILARQAGESTLTLFQRPGLVVDRKRDGSVVTAADRNAEQFLRDAIRAQFPDDAVLGEEWGELPGSSGYRWILDPIDGTASFVCGVPLYGTLIGIQDMTTGKVVAGVIEMPAMNERVYGGPGLGAFHQAGSATVTAARVSKVSSLKDAVICKTSLDYFLKAGRPDVYIAMHEKAGLVRGWGDCYAFLLVITGRADAAVEPSLKIWDIAAIAPIVEAAGGRWSDWAGNPDVSSGSAVVSNGPIHDELLYAVR